MVTHMLSNTNYPHCGFNLSANDYYSLNSPTMSYLQAVDRADKITFYIDPVTGKKIDYDDYWFKKNFESQPAFIFGKLIRDVIATVGKEVSECTISFAKQTSDLCSTFYAGIKQLPNLLKSNQNQLQQNFVDEVEFERLYGDVNEQLPTLFQLQQKFVDDVEVEKLLDNNDVNELSEEEFVHLIIRQIDEYIPTMFNEVVEAIRKAKKEADSFWKALNDIAWRKPLGPVFS